MGAQIQVVDNFLPAQLADSLEHMLLGNEFPWYYTPDITYGHSVNQEVKNPAFSHSLYREETGPSSFYLSVCNLPFLGSVKVTPSRVSRAVALMQTPQMDINSSLHNHPHVDTPNPHIVFLYYVCDSDGDTFMFSTDKDDHTITKQVTPKKNRALIFDGSIYHASSKPKASNRCVINFNLNPFEQ